MSAINSILCALDLSPGSERVLAQAAELAELMVAQLTVLFVYQVPLLPLEEGDGEARSLPDRRSTLERCGVLNGALG